METTMTIRGRSITSSDIQRIQCFMDENPQWHRTKLSQELCIAWDWKAHNGQYKDMACRGLLLKLEKLGLITLPPRCAQSYNSLRNRLTHPVQRPAVQSRKLSYCTCSDKGQIVRARLLTVWQSCRMQRRNPDNASLPTSSRLECRDP